MNTTATAMLLRL